VAEIRSSASKERIGHCRDVVRSAKIEKRFAEPT
jgi:hypothetical protein